jgi:hypothetical protein
MSVIMTMKLSADPARFEQTLNAESDRLGRIVEVANGHGLIAHRWYGGEGDVMAVDEWPDPDSFRAFFQEAQGEIGPLMQSAGVAGEPAVTFWRPLQTGDEVGWGA